MGTSKLTHKEIRERTLQTLVESAAAVGKPFAEQGRKLLQIAAKQAKPSPEDHFAAAHLQLMYRHLSQEAKRLAKKGCTEEELQNTLKQLKELMAKGPTAIRKAMDQMRKELPKRGGPGRKELLNDSEKREVIRHVSRLLESGRMTYRDIFESVADSLNSTRQGKTVTARTIRRAWEKRRQLP